MGNATKEKCVLKLKRKCKGARLIENNDHLDDLAVEIEAPNDCSWGGVIHNVIVMISKSEKKYKLWEKVYQEIDKLPEIHNCHSNCSVSLGETCRYWELATTK